MRFKRALLLLCTIYLPLNAITLVYNLRIRRSFGALDYVFGKERKAIWAFSGVPIVFKRTASIVDCDRGVNVSERRLAVGSLFNFRYIPNRRWWFEVTTAVEKEYAESTGTTVFSKTRTGLDDIVFDGGCHLFPEKRAQVVLYGIGGVPTRRKVTAIELQDTLVGTRFFSAGAGAELSYSFFSELKRSLIVLCQGRFLHFFSRDFFPALPQGGRIQPGNVSDLLCAVRYRRKKNIFEAGYNLTVFSDQAIIVPTETIESDTFIRNGAYASMYHFFSDVPLLHKPMLIGVGFSASRTQKFDANTYSGWLVLSMPL